jgi:heavy metal translocating P-type ATPase
MIYFLSNTYKTITLLFFLSEPKFFLLFIKRYPIPIFAIFGLISGSIFHWLLNQENLGHWIWIGTLIIGGIPIIFDTIRNMIHRQFAADIIAMLAIITAILANEALPGVVIVIMQSGGKALEDYAFRKATTSLDALLARSPRIAHRKKNNMIEEIDVNLIKVGDLLVVRPGDLIPVDGHLVTYNNNNNNNVGATTAAAVVDESSLTGEPIPKTKKVGDLLFSGTVNVGNDAFEMITDKLTEESQYSKIVQMVRKAQEEKAPIQRLADKYAIWFTPITIFISFFGWLITGRIETILSVLVVASPCSLIFATPIAIIGGINKAAKSGIIIKNGSSLEQIGKADSIVFDKTGTITFGTPSIEKVISLNKSVNSNDILFKAACLEQLSSHPTAKVITQKAQEKFGKLPLPNNFHEITGIGVEGFLDGEHIVVGSQSILENILDKHLVQKILDLKKQNQFKGKMLAFVTADNIPVGIIVFGDIIRSGVKSMIEHFRNIGVEETMILSGDSYENSQIIAQEIGVNSFRANLLPEHKVNEVKKLREKYKNVIMIGDGINDAPALAVSTIGIAMGAHGTAISAEAADIVLLVDDITRVKDAIEISKRTIHIAKQSIYVGLGASFVFMIIASFGMIPPTIGALIQELMDVAVILNALRAR